MAMTDKYVLDDDGNARVENDLMTWAAWMERGDRHLAVTRTPDGTRISTVFLGLDHNFGLEGSPILWETMVFDTDGPWQSYQDRYATRDEAKRGHDAIVEAITAGKLPEGE